MNVRTARQILRTYCPGGGDEERDVREALKVARRTPELDADFQSQLSFDKELSELLEPRMTEDLKKDLADAACRLEQSRKRKFSVRDPAIFSVILAFLALVVLGVWMLMGRMGSFAGMQEAVEIVQQGDKAGAGDFEEIDVTAGSLPDWFVMKSFDGFAVPKGLEKLPVVGVRLTKYDDTPVAVAVIADPKMICYSFDAAPFGIAIPEGEWKVVRYGPGNRKAMAVTEVAGMAFVMTLHQGGRDELEKFLMTLR